MEMIRHTISVTSQGHLRMTIRVAEGSISGFGPLCVVDVVEMTSNDMETNIHMLWLFVNGTIKTPDMYTKYHGRYPLYKEGDDKPFMWNGPATFTEAVRDIIN